MKKNLKIGSQIYLVHKDYVNKNFNGSSIRICRIKSYQNVNGKVLPIVREVGSSNSIQAEYYITFQDLDKAIEAISNKKFKKRRNLDNKRYSTKFV